MDASLNSRQLASSCVVARTNFQFQNRHREEVDAGRLILSHQLREELILPQLMSDAAILNSDVAIHLRES